MALGDKVVITCAVTGAVTAEAQCPAIPYSAVEIAEECRRAHEAGAAVVHVHGRADDGTPSYDPAVFAAYKREIEARCPIIINFSTGAIDLSREDRIRHITTTKPAIAALNMGSMNYAKYSAKRKSFIFSFVFANPFDDIIYYLKEMTAAGVRPEMECFDTGHVASLEPLIDMGLLKAPFDINLVMGVTGGIPATADHLQFQATHLPKGAVWKTTPISGATWPLSAMALGMGGNVRVGLEDNFYLPSGDMVKSNGDLVGHVAKMARDAGRTPATVAEARQIRALGMNMRERVADLERRRAEIKQMGGADKVAKQHERGKLTARERLDRFFDGGAWFEVGMHGTQMTAGDDKPPADAVICGYGHVDGRLCCAAAYDFTVKGGSIGIIGETKVTRMRELALRNRVPMVWFVDSAGARIDPKAVGAADFVSLFAGSGHLFREEVIMSGVVPLVAAMVGPGAAGTAYIPGLADFVPMMKNVGSMALAGPPLVKAVTGQDIAEQDLGGSKVHTETSGVGDIEVADDDACIASIKTYLSFMPSSCGDKPPIIATADPVDRREERLLDIVPDEARKPYDMYEVLKLVVDDGRLFDLKPKFGRAIITALARIGGRPCGIVASNPKQLGGILTNDSADKAARFIQICDAFNVPLIFMMDVPGFMVGSKVEHEGIIRHGAKMLHAMASATVPKLTVVVRKGYGAGYYVMAGRAYEPDLLVAWPGAEIAVMGAEGMVGIAGRKLFGGAEPPPEAKAQLTQMIQKEIDIYKVAGWGLVDDVIDPRDTRKTLALALELSWNKHVERPWRKHGVMPV